MNREYRDRPKEYTVVIQGGGTALAACNPWEYRQVTAGVFQSLRSLAQREGFHIPNTPSGEFTIQRSGVSVFFHYTWNQNNGALRLTCMRKPGIVSCGVVKGIADQILRQCGASPA